MLIWLLFQLHSCIQQPQTKVTTEATSTVMLRRLRSLNAGNLFFSVICVLLWMIQVSHTNENREKKRKETICPSMFIFYFF
mmetsp:Transcript_7142/g.18506  ORF Transcript_7142/g.18506 Transcript_7142/m.18506 type:complete len:81 (-) Transcript_7142:821-1063(-)